MNISFEARDAAQVLTDYLAIRGFKDGQAAIAMQTLIDQTIERCAAKCDDLAADEGWPYGGHYTYAAHDIRSLKSNGGGDE